MTIQVRQPGLLTTVQDLGRYHQAHLGISPAGAADPLALRVANLLIGNQQGAAALEMTLVGATLEFEQACLVALAGSDADCTMAGEAVPLWEAIQVPAGAVLACRAIKTGARLYLAVQGGIEVPLLMGSASTHLAGKFGGIQGRQLKKGDSLHLVRGPASGIRKLRPGATEQFYPAGPIRVTRGLQQNWFAQQALETFFSSTYTVSDESNRSGLRLKGEPLQPRTTSQLLTEGVPLGAIQVPRDGQPILLLGDQQTTGGYPKIANVIAADMHRAGQLRPREHVRFAEVEISRAVALLQEQEQWLKQIFLA
jgi:antagonist of KipI